MLRLTLHRSPASRLARSVFGLSLCLFGTGVGYGQEVAPVVEADTVDATVDATSEVTVTPTADTSPVGLAVADEAKPAAEAKPVEEAKPAASPKSEEEKPAGDKPAEAKPDEKSQQPHRPAFGGRGGRGPGLFGGPPGGGPFGGAPFGRGGFGGMSRPGSGQSPRDFAGPRPEGRRVGNRSGNEGHRMGSESRGPSRHFAHRGRGGRDAGRYVHNSRGGSRHGRGHLAHSSRGRSSHGSLGDFGRGPSCFGGRPGHHSMSHHRFPGGRDRSHGGPSFGPHRWPQHGHGPMASREMGPGRDHGPRPGMDRRPPMHSRDDHRPGFDRPHGPPRDGGHRHPGEDPRGDGPPRGEGRGR